LTLQVTKHHDCVIFAVKVIPGARSTRIVGILGEALKVTVACAPEKGKANKALTAYLAKQFKCNKSSVKVVSGLTNAYKQVQVEDMDDATLYACLSKWL